VGFNFRCMSGRMRVVLLSLRMGSVRLGRVRIIMCENDYGLSVGLGFVLWVERGFDGVAAHRRLGETLSRSSLFMFL